MVIIMLGPLLDKLIQFTCFHVDAFRNIKEMKCSSNNVVSCSQDLKHLYCKKILSYNVLSYSQGLRMPIGRKCRPLMKPRLFLLSNTLAIAIIHLNTSSYTRLFEYVPLVPITELTISPALLSRTCHLSD